MRNKIQLYLNESKSNIGWIHGLLSCFIAVISAFLSMMIISIILPGDYANRTIPLMILTPILTSVYGLYFLFSKKMIIVLKKMLFILLALIVLYIFSLKVF